MNEDRLRAHPALLRRRGMLEAEEVIADAELANNERSLGSARPALRGRALHTAG